MAASVKGIQVSFGIPASAVTNSAAVTTAGIVESFSVQLGGNTEEIVDEDGDFVSRVDHGASNKLSLEVLIQATSTVPTKGTVITGLSAVQGITLNTGAVLVDDAQVMFAKAGVAKLSVSATHYPGMTAT
jgi:hypothetical protein